MYDYLKNEKKDLASPADDEPQNSDEEWEALLERHSDEMANPPALPDPKDPFNMKDNRLSTKEKKRLYYREDILLVTLENYLASSRKFADTTDLPYVCSSLDDVWMGRQENMTVLMIEPISQVGMWGSWQAHSLEFHRDGRKTHRPL